jgi:urocanate hydratase
LALNPIEPAAFDFLLQVERLYASLMAGADAMFDPDRERSLSGLLLYAGELDGEGRALLVAGNIGGAATLAATTDVAAQRQAIHDGVADFLVTSLDEALRILKNEIRKHETVAVCVAAAPEAVEREMLERGVLPNLLRRGASVAPEYAPFLTQGARQIQILDPEKDETLLTWRVAAAPAQWLPKLDDLALDLLQHEDWVSRRWLRLAPRYLGRLGQGMRLLVCDREFAAVFIEQTRGGVERGEIGVAVEIQVTGRGVCDRHSFLLPLDSES